MKLTRSLAVAITLLGLTIQAQAIVTFETPRKVAQKCELVAQGETIYLDVYIYPDYNGVHYVGPMTGVTSSGVPVSCYGTISVRRGITIEFDSLSIGDSCEFGNLRVKGTYIFSGF
jgi:hypothetical protein